MVDTKKMCPICVRSDSEHAVMNVLNDGVNNRNRIIKIVRHFCCRLVARFVTTSISALSLPIRIAKKKKISIVHLLLSFLMSILSNKVIANSSFEMWFFFFTGNTKQITDIFGRIIIATSPLRFLLRSIACEGVNKSTKFEQQAIKHQRKRKNKLKIASHFIQMLFTLPADANFFLP